MRRREGEKSKGRMRKRGRVKRERTELRGGKRETIQGERRSGREV